MRVGPVGLERVNGPHGKVAHQQEGHDLSARLLLDLLSVEGKPSDGDCSDLKVMLFRQGNLPAWGVQNEQRLQCRLDEGRQRGQKCQEVFLQLKKGPNNAKRRVDEDSSLRDDQQQVVQV